MSYLDGTGTSVFPLQFVKESIASYTVKHNKPPKVLLVSSTDFLDYKLNCTLPSPAALGLEEISCGSDVNEGEFYLGAGFKEKKK